jgi:hypothetical protein
MTRPVTRGEVLGLAEDDDEGDGEDEDDALGLDDELELALGDELELGLDDEVLEAVAPSQQEVSALS